MLETNLVEGAYTGWLSGGFSAGGKLGFTGSYTPYGNRSLLGYELNLGAGLPAGPLPMNGAVGVSNTFVVWDFYHEGGKERK